MTRRIGAIPFASGEGLKVYAKPSDPPWYGSGYCAVCGGEPFPARVRFWDPDDGWRSGVLCVGCAEEASERGPRSGDFAYREPGVEVLPRSTRMDLLAALLDGDDDAAHVEAEDLR